MGAVMVEVDGEASATCGLDACADVPGAEIGDLEGPVAQPSALVKGAEIATVRAHQENLPAEASDQG